jgi:hypothetical protein
MGRYQSETAEKINRFPCPGLSRGRIAAGSSDAERLPQFEPRQFARAQSR